VLDRLPWEPGKSLTPTWWPFDTIELAVPDVRTKDSRIALDSDLDRLIQSFTLEGMRDSPRYLVHWSTLNPAARQVQTF